MKKSFVLLFAIACSSRPGVSPDPETCEPVFPDAGTPVSKLHVYDDLEFSSRSLSRSLDLSDASVQKAKSVLVTIREQPGLDHDVIPCGD